MKDIDRDAKLYELNRESDNEEEEEENRISLLREMNELNDLMENEGESGMLDTVVRRKPVNRTELRRSLFREKVQLYVDSPEYNQFMKLLEDVADDPNYCVCLSCWRFVNLFQKKIHEIKGHNCLKAGTFNNHLAFRHYNTMY